MIEKLEINKHPKYGTELTRGRRGNGWRRSKTRQYRLELGYKNTPHRHIWITGVFFDEVKNRLLWFSNLWHRKFWRIIFNRRVRHIKNIPDYNFYRRLFYLVLNCDRISLHCNRVNYHELKNYCPKICKKIVTKKYYEPSIRTKRLKWLPVYGRVKKFSAQFPK